MTSSDTSRDISQASVNLHYMPPDRNLSMESYMNDSTEQRYYNDSLVHNERYGTSFNDASLGNNFGYDTSALHDMSIYNRSHSGYSMYRDWTSPYLAHDDHPSSFGYIMEDHLQPASQYHVPDEYQNDLAVTTSDIGHTSFHGYNGCMDEWKQSTIQLPPSPSCKPIDLQYPYQPINPKIDDEFNLNLLAGEVATLQNSSLPPFRNTSLNGTPSKSPRRRRNIQKHLQWKNTSISNLIADNQYYSFKDLTPPLQNLVEKLEFDQKLMTSLETAGVVEKGGDIEVDECLDFDHLIALATKEIMQPPADNIGNENSVKINQVTEVKDNQTRVNEQNKKNTGKRKVGKIALEGQRRKQIKAMLSRQEISKEVSKLNDLIPYAACHHSRTPKVTTVLKAREYIDQMKFEIKDAITSIGRLQQRTNKVVVDWPKDMDKYLPDLTIPNEASLVKNNCQEVDIFASNSNTEKLFKNDIKQNENVDSETKFTATSTKCQPGNQAGIGNSVSTASICKQRSLKNPLSNEKQKDLHDIGDSVEQELPFDAQDSANCDEGVERACSILQSLIKGKISVNDRLNIEISSKVNDDLAVSSHKKATVKQSDKISLRSASKRKNIVKKHEKKKEKRAMNSFMLFSKINRPHLCKTFKYFNNRDISKILGESWQNLSDRKKASWKELAKKPFLSVEEYAKISEAEKYRHDTGTFMTARIQINAPSFIQHHPRYVVHLPYQGY